MLALREGLGFSYACELSNNSAKEVSSIIEQDNAFREDCQKAVLGASTDFLKMSSDFAEKQDYKKSLEAKENAKKYGKLVLWESYCKKEEIDGMKMAKALAIYKFEKDAATAVGLTFDEYIEYLSCDDAIMRTAEKMGYGKDF